MATVKTALSGLWRVCCRARLLARSLQKSLQRFNWPDNFVGGCAA